MTADRVAAPFQTCGSCKRAWSTWESFVLDPEVRLLGLQAVIINPDFNALVFEHRCGGSISVLAPRLRHILTEPEPAEPPALLLGTDDCRGHCRLLEDLEACDAPCRNAPDRRLTVLIHRMKQRAPSPARNQ